MPGCNHCVELKVIATAVDRVLLHASSEEPGEDHLFIDVHPARWAALGCPSTVRVTMEPIN